MHGNRSVSSIYISVLWHTRKFGVNLDDQLTDYGIARTVAHRSFFGHLALGYLELGTLLGTNDQICNEVVRFLTIARNGSVDLDVFIRILFKEPDEWSIRFRFLFSGFFMGDFFLWKLVSWEFDGADRDGVVDLLRRYFVRRIVVRGSLGRSLVWRFFI